MTKLKKNEMRNTKLEGIINISYKGTGTIRIPDTEEVVNIEHGFLGTAFSGDTVEVILHPKKDIQTGEVVRIINRSKKGYAGVLEQDGSTYFLTPSDLKIYTDIIIPSDKLNGAQKGQKVFATISKWEDMKKNPIGEIIKVLGRPTENNAEMEAIALEKGFNATFPSVVLDEAIKISKEGITSKDHEGRRDLRKTTTFTIDPVDAKDFDDAISIQKLPNGRFEIGVHIADVSHYVKKDNILDKEARDRGTSVYLVDRTIPMLPEELSNDICSLKPNVDRLTFSVLFEMDKEGQVYGKWFGRTIIHSDKRFTYEEAQKILDNKKGEFLEELNTLNNISKKLLKKRFEKGAISLEQAEVRFKLDENGVPLSVYVKERGDTNKMIEELMLLANRAVAEKISDKSGGKDFGVFLYRIHDTPNKEKVKDLVSFLKKLGYKIKLTDGIITPEEINKLVSSLEESPLKDTINTAIIRTMAKAVYSTKNIGHFGLGFKHYTHFTSPIRRYPDVIVHRLLHEYIEKRSIAKEHWKDYERISQESSLREKEASEAERSSIKYKQVEYMSSRIGEKFEGTITGVTEWGLYIEDKETKCEGMVSVRDLGDDFYVFDKKGMSIVGQKKRRRFTLGDKVKFKVKDTNINKKTIDYQLI